VLILAALPEEIAPLAREMKITRRVDAGRCRAALGRLQGVPVILATTGDGAANAARGVHDLFDRLPVGGMIIAGVAGALSPALAPGRVLIAREVVEGGRPLPPPDKRWMERALRETGAEAATFVSSSTILGTSAAKAAAYAVLTREGAASVDLESATFAREAASRGVPYVALRAITDAADESLPLDFNAFRDRTGAVDRRRVALAAALHPSLIPALWRLRGRVALCSSNLARAVRAILAGGVR